MLEEFNKFLSNVVHRLFILIPKLDALNIRCFYSNIFSLSFQEMADIFYARDVNKIFKGKSVLFLGDSIMRFFTF